MLFDCAFEGMYTGARKNHDYSDHDICADGEPYSLAERPTLDQRVKLVAIADVMMKHSPITIQDVFSSVPDIRRK